MYACIVRARDVDAAFSRDRQLEIGFYFYLYKPEPTTARECLFGHAMGNMLRAALASSPQKQMDLSV